MMSQPAMARVLSHATLAGASTRHRPPLANRAGLAGPRELADELPLTHDRAAAFPARPSVKVFTALADGETTGDLFLAGLRHSGGYVLGGRGGEVAGLLDERQSRLWVARIRRVVNVHHNQVAVLADDAGPHLVERVATLTAALFKVRQLALNHGSGLHCDTIHPSSPTAPANLDRNQ